MKKYFLPFLTAMAAVVLVACSKSDEDDTFYGVKAELDGVEWEVKQGEADVNSFVWGEDISVYALNEDNEGFYIWLEETTIPGTYDLPNSEVLVIYVKESMALDSYDFVSGTMTIKKFEHTDGIHFKATFNGVASHNFTDVDDIVITDGEMEVKF